MRALAIAVLLAACGGGATPAPTTPPPPAENTVDDGPTTPPADPADDPTEPADDEDAYATGGIDTPVDQASLDAGGTGAPACDELLARTRCMYAKTPGVPPEAIKEFNEGAASWRDAVLNDATRQAIIDACKMSLDAAHDGYVAVGC